MLDTVHYGLIGCGMMGQEHLRNIALLPDARVAAIFEPDPGMRRIAELIVPDARFYDSVEALLDSDPLDALLIASPNHLHLMQLELVADRRPIPVLCEKPIYTDPADADRIGRLANTYAAPIWVAMEYRYMPPIARFLAEVEQATGGVKMLTIREHRFPFLDKVNAWNRFNRNTGGTLVEKCCHFFDLMRLATGSEAVRVMASAGQAVNHKSEIYDGVVPDIWDSGYIIVDFANGARAMLELCMFAEGARYQEEISAVGPKGKIETMVPGPARFWPDHLGRPPVPRVVISPRDPKGPTRYDMPVDPALLKAGDHNGATYYQHQKFIRMVREGTLPQVSLMDGIASVAIAHAAQRSAETGQAVVL